MLFELESRQGNGKKQTLIEIGSRSQLTRRDEVLENALEQSVSARSTVLLKF
jgi:hypothetical protein